MSLIKLLKKSVPRLPYAIGNMLSKLPYEQRPFLSKVYRKRKEEIQAYSLMGPQQKRGFVFERVQDIVQHAYSNVEFYRKHYDEKGFHPDALNGFDDLKQIPVICKKDLRSVELEHRTTSNWKGGRVHVNTGGSTGSPLGFYIQPESYGHEKAHMDHIWSKLGYSQRDSILTFSGRSKLKTPIQYDALRHAFLVDIYQPMELIIESLEQLERSGKLPRFLHGYPSAIFDFLAQLDQSRPDLTSILQKSIEGTFFGSEYPNPQWRNRIESLTGAGTVSWYGHTERCVLAWESDGPFEFTPFQTYGYAESVKTDAGEQLIGTSYYNFVCPMIRYNTEDGIEVIDSTNEILESFKILDGRVGEFVLDRNGKKIPLTGLIYGRHHRLFNYCRSLQISQQSPGLSKIHYCALPGVDLPEPASALFDSSGVEIDFSYESCAEPIRTKAGKIGLLVESR